MCDFWDQGLIPIMPLFEWKPIMLARFLEGVAERLPATGLVVQARAAGQGFLKCQVVGSQGTPLSPGNLANCPPNRQVLASVLGT